MLAVVKKLHVTAAEHMGCNTPAVELPAVAVVEVDMVPADHSQAVSMRHTVPVAAVAAACRGWRGAAHIAAGLGAAGGSTGVLEVGNGGGWVPEDCMPPAVEILVQRPVQSVATIKSCHVHM